MDDKERYKRAFNTLVSSDVFENEEDIINMAKTQKTGKRFFRASTVAAALVAVLLLGSVTAYATNAGDVRTKVNGFVLGKSTEISVVEDGDNLAAYDSEGNFVAGVENSNDVADFAYMLSNDSSVDFNYIGSGKDARLDLYFRGLDVAVQDEINEGYRAFRLTAPDGYSACAYVQLDGNGILERIDTATAEVIEEDFGVTEFIEKN